MEMDNKHINRLPRIVLGLFSGIGIFMVIVAIIQLFTGEFDAFFGLIFSGVIFYGLGWAGRRVLTPRDKDAPPDIGKIAGGIATFAMVSDWGSGDEPWFILIFPIVGLILIIATIRIGVRRKKSGIGVLKLDEVPAWLGERLKGVIETGVSADQQPADGFKLRLVCVERSSYRNSDGDKKVREKELWSEEQQVYGSVSSKDFTFALTVYFNIPDNLPPTLMIPEDDRTLWRVEASASTPGVDYAAKFEVPVFDKSMHIK